MFKSTLKREAFSMLELIFVIVILGIVASIGSEAIAKVYENYIVQKAQHKTSIKTQIVTNLIANRLRYAMPDTIARRAGLLGLAEGLQETLASGPDAYTVLQWVGSDNDSFQAIIDAVDLRPGWSGFCDIDASTTTVISTPGSNLALTTASIGFLSAAAPLGIADAAIYFPNDPLIPIAHGIASVAGTNITLDAPTLRAVERYKLAWTSYALSIEGGDLWLYSNFPPNYQQAIGGTRTRLLRNVVNFKFQGAGRTLRFKLCVRENTGAGLISSCKEKAVF